MRNVQSFINGQSYFFATGFETRSYIATALNDRRLFEEDGTAINPGKFALGVLRVAGAEYHTNVKWDELIPTLPNESHDEVWDAVNAILDIAGEPDSPAPHSIA